MRRKIRSHILSVIVILISLSILTVTFLVFRRTLTSKLRETEENHLSENSHTVSEVFYTKLDDQLTMLESQARYLQSIDLSDYNAMKDTIESTKGIGGFKNIGAANSSGATINYNGISSGNIYLTNYFTEAMKGHNAISETTIIDEDGDEVLVLAVPIMKDGKAVGVIYGTFTKSTIDSIIDSISISKDSIDLVVTSEEKILAHSTNTPGITIDSSAQLLSDIIPEGNVPDDNKETTLYYSQDGKKYIAEMTPIGVHDWYFVSILPETVVTDQTTQITIYVSFAIAAVAVVFLIILLHIHSLLKNTDRFIDQASTDSLTGILNKGTFRTNVCEAMDRYKDGLALFIIDLDDFKSVNDNLGHVMGDKVLTDVAKKLSLIFGGTDKVGRIGGDEFSAFLPIKKEKEDIVEYAKVACSEIDNTYSAHGSSVHVSVSVGIAFYPGDGGDYEALYKNADLALYKCKSSGKNTYAVYSKEEIENETH